MITIFKYRFLSIVRKRVLIFWNLIFPLVLVTFFGLTLVDMYKPQQYESIPIAVVKNESLQADYGFQNTLSMIEEQDEPLFQVAYTTLEEAGKMLEDDTVDGIIEKGDTFQLYVKKSGLNQTILQSFLDEYIQKSNTIAALSERGIPIEDILSGMETTPSYIASRQKENSDVSSIFFFSIIAMCCLYGSYISLNCIHSTQANQSDLGARNSISPLPKTNLLLIDFIISYVIDFLILMIMLLYMVYGLGIDFGSYSGHILLCIAVGVLAGNSFGVLIGVVITKKKDMKEGILTASTLFLSMLSGMMFAQMKYFMDTYLPIISHMNPANMITDSLYSLYYYGPCERYYMNISSLLVFAGICYGISFLMIRRKQYASI